MNKKYAFILALLLTFFIANMLYLLSFQSQKNSKISVVVARVIDGDTLKTQDNKSIRLLNINSPEKNMPNAEMSKNFLQELKNKSITLEIIGYDKYNRVLARLYNPDYINLELVKLGLSSKFLVEDSELSEFSEAEKNAIKQGLGIWVHSAYFGCFKSKIFKDYEKVILESICNKINLSGWYLKDESRKTYYFKDIILSKITLHSKIGEDNATDIFWNSKEDVWNNDRDSLYLFNEKGEIAHYETYGY